MTELILFIVGVAWTVLIAALAYGAARDAAERRADFTISALRHQISKQRIELEELRAETRHLGRMVSGGVVVEPKVPQWGQS